MNEIDLDSLYEAVGEGVISPAEFIQLATFWVASLKVGSVCQSTTT